MYEHLLMCCIAVGSADDLIHLPRQRGSLQRDQREGGAARGALHRDARPARRVPAPPADSGARREHVRAQVSGPRHVGGVHLKCVLYLCTRLQYVYMYG